MRLAILLMLPLCARAELATIPVGSSTLPALDPASPLWKGTAAASLSLQRTPVLYATDPAAALDISSVQIRVIRGSGNLFVRLEWQDKTKNAAELRKAERSWQGEHLVAQSGATNRFPDACAVMLPVHPDSAGVFPSLQMGDAAHPVNLYLWDATRGTTVMEARGRETTKRTGQSFPAQSSWTNGTWAVTMQLPDVPAGTPLAVAIWNGDQQDRDGRKYFTIWYKTQ